ncbi:hypothetical protein OAH12_01640 [Cyclobacteriaceae bacterium]|nr:hypothetical protein [Cyclobacteriaceae bacterium]
MKKAHYILDKQRLRHNLEKWTSIHPNIEVAYSLKANYSPLVLETIVNHLDYLEVCSQYEYNMAKQYVDADHILVNGPSHSSEFLTQLTEEGAFIIVNNLSQYQELTKIVDTTTSIGLRLQFEDFPSTRFGISVDDLSEITDKNLKVSMLHCHYCDNFRTSDSYKQRLVALQSLDTFSDIQSYNIGGGFYSQMPDQLKSQFSTKIDQFENYYATLSSIDLDKKCFLEIGNALVADTISYQCSVSHIEQKKNTQQITVNGSKWDIQPNGSNRYLPVATNSNTSELIETVVYGYTCMENDILFQGLLPKLCVGDELTFSNCGAYAQSLAPDFIQQKKELYAR